MTHLSMCTENYQNKRGMKYQSLIEEMEQFIYFWLYTKVPLRMVAGNPWHFKEIDNCDSYKIAED